MSFKKEPDMSFKVVVRKNWRYIVVSLALLVGIALLSQSVFASVGASTIQAAAPANPANHTLAGDPKTESRCPGTSSAGVCDHTQRSVEGAITDTPTDSVTPSPAMLVGHVSRQGVCCSNNVQPISLTLSMGGTQIDYPAQ